MLIVYGPEPPVDATIPRDPVAPKVAPLIEMLVSPAAAVGVIKASREVVRELVVRDFVRRNQKKEVT